MQKQKTLVMKNLIASKSGQICMGSYNKNITAIIELQEQSTIVTGNYKIDIPAIYRVGYTCDSADECFRTYDEAVDRYNYISSHIF